MFGISFGEILLIVTVGLIIVGPKRLPETARFIGHLFSRVHQQVSSVKADIRREMDLEDIKSIHREYEDASKNAHDAFKQAAAHMGKEAEYLRKTTLVTDSTTDTEPPTKTEKVET